MLSEHELFLHPGNQLMNTFQLQCASCGNPELIEMTTKQAARFPPGGVDAVMFHLQHIVTCVVQSLRGCDGGQWMHLYILKASC